MLRAIIRRPGIFALLLTLFLGSGCLSKVTPAGSGDNPSGEDPSTQNPNSAPRISGSPNAAVKVGDTYSFTPTATDADGDALTFSVTNKPRWASFDSRTGRLSGDALLGDAGFYDQIRITVSDGDASASLPAFSITVTDVALGSMSLSWTPPTENTDGSPLVDLAGYNIYYGVTAGAYTHTARIDNPSVSTFLVENLLPDTYYVVATSFNALGVESSFSNVAVKVVTTD